VYSLLLLCGGVAEVTTALFGFGCGFVEVTLLLPCRHGASLTTDRAMVPNASAGRCRQRDDHTAYATYV